MSIRAFDNILLEDTFVFSWHRTHDLLTFNVLASLLQSHPEASPPTSGDWACYRPAVIQFRGVTSVDGLLPQESVNPTIDPDGTVDYGCIDALALIRPGRYCIAGEFGSVTVVAQEVSIAIGAAA